MVKVMGVHAARQGAGEGIGGIPDTGLWIYLQRIQAEEDWGGDGDSDGDSDADDLYEPPKSSMEFNGGDSRMKRAEEKKAEDEAWMPLALFVMQLLGLREFVFCHRQTVED